MERGCVYQEQHFGGEGVVQSDWNAILFYRLSCGIGEQRVWCKSVGSKRRGDIVTKNFVLNETFSDLYEEVGGDLKLSAIFEAEELFKGQQASSEGYYEFYDCLLYTSPRPRD